MIELSNLRLCFLAGTLEHGGAERQLFYILQALREAGAAPRLLCLDRGQFWEEPIRALGVPITWVGRRASRLGRLVAIFKELRREPADLFQSQHFFANAYAGVAAWLSPARAIGAMRSDGCSEVLGSGTAGAWMNLHSPRIIAANSQVAVQYALARGVPPSKLYFLPNVVDTDRFKPADHPAQGPLTLIAVGRFAREKRLDRFVRILASLRRDAGLDVRGLMVGPAGEDRDLRSQLEAQCRTLGLPPGAVQMRGGASDMAPVYHEAAVCVLTSDFEGTPNVLLEAMASGLPVVATNVGGVPGIVQPGHNGFLLDPEDIEGFVASLAGLARDTQSRQAMGRRARVYVEQRHSLRRLPGYLGELYRMALPAGPQGADRQSRPLRPSIPGRPALPHLSTNERRGG